MIALSVSVAVAVDGNREASADDVCAVTQSLTINNSSSVPPSPLFGVPGSGGGAGPYGVAVDDTGNIYAADPTSDHAYKFTTDGTQLWSSVGYPLDADGIAVDDDGNVYMGAYPNRIYKYGSDGALLDTLVGSYSVWPNPRGLAVDDATDYLYFADRSVFRTTTDLATPVKWVEASDATPAWHSIGGVAVGSDGDVYVAGGYHDGTSYVGIVYVFDSNGNQIDTFQHPSSSPRFWGVGVDDAGNVFASSDGAAAVYGFAPNGDLFFTLDNSSSPAPSPAFIDPHYVAVDGAGEHLYVSDRWTHTLYRFDLDCTAEPVIVDGGYNITAASNGEFNYSFGFETHVRAQADWAPDGPSLSDVVAKVDGVELTLEGIEVQGYDSGAGVWDFTANGSFPGLPPLGTYSIEVTDAGGTDSFVVGELLDTPEGFPEIVAGSGQVGPMPTFSWTAFQSEYNGTDVDPWAYEMNLEAPDDFYWVWPISAGQTTLTFDDSAWEPDTPDPLPVGVHHGVLHSNHAVQEGFNFEHHVEFLVVVSGGGFVTGGGWFDSPTGAYAPDPDVDGTTNLGFNVKLHKGVPQGNLQVQIHDADINFHAFWIELLVVDEGSAYFRGAGTINGEGEYWFEATVTDGDPDAVELQIWDGGDLLYEVATPLGGGSIVVHQK